LSDFIVEFRGAAYNCASSATGRTMFGSCPPLAPSLES